MKVKRIQVLLGQYPAMGATEYVYPDECPPACMCSYCTAQYSIQYGAEVVTSNRISVIYAEIKRHRNEIPILNDATRIAMKRIDTYELNNIIGYADSIGIQYLKA